MELIILSVGAEISSGEVFTRSIIFLTVVPMVCRTSIVYASEQSSSFVRLRIVRRIPISTVLTMSSSSSCFAAA